MDNLKKIRIFRGIEDIGSLLKCIPYAIKVYRKGEYIYSVNDIINNMCIILDGEVYIEKEDYWGNRYIINKLGAGEMFAESIVFSGDRRMRVNVVVSKKSRIMFLDYKNIVKTCEKSCELHKVLIYNLLCEVSNKNVILINKMGHMCKRTIKEKVLSYLSEEALISKSSTFTIKFNRQELSDYLSVDRSALSTVLHNLRNEGYIDFNKNTFTLKY